MINKKIIRGFSPLAHQRAVIDILNEHHEGATIVIKSSRQKGKTLLLLQVFLQNALKYKNTNSIIIEPTNAGCRRVMKDLESQIGAIPIIENVNYQFYEITFKNGSTIAFKSAESEDNLRGISLKKNSLLAFDEAAFIDDEVYGIVIPFCNVHNNTKLIVSTPKFKNGQFFKYYERALNKEKNYFLIDFNDYDTSSLISEEQLNDAKNSMPMGIFMNEYMGEFLSEEGNVFGKFGDIINNSFNVNNREFYIGVDWSQNSGNDNTAIVVFNSERQQVFLRYFNDKNIFETIDEIIDIMKRYFPRRVTVEANSMGDTNFQLLKNEAKKNKLNVEICKFTTTNQSKRKIIENMVVGVQNKTLQFLDNTEMKLELAAYEMQSTKSGMNITYNAKSPSHDDLVMASAICLDSMTHGQYIVR